MPRKICLAFGCFWSLLLLTSSVSADRVFILSRLLAIQQPGNTHGIYRPLLIALAAQDVSASETVVALATKNYKGIIFAVHRPRTRRNLFELDKAPVASVSAAQPEVVANGRRNVEAGT